VKGCFYFLQGQLGNQRGKRKEKEKKVACAKLDIHLEHALYLDQSETKMNLMPPWKPLYDHHTPPKRYGNISYVDACVPCTNHLFLYNIYTKSITKHHL